MNEAILWFHIQLILMAWHPFSRTSTYSMDKSQILHVSWRPNLMWKTAQLYKFSGFEGSFCCTFVFKKELSCVLLHQVQDHNKDSLIYNLQPTHLYGLGSIKSESLIILDACNSHKNNIAMLVLEFAKSMLLLLRNLTETVANETRAVQLNCHRHTWTTSRMIRSAKCLN